MKIFSWLVLILNIVAVLALFGAYSAAYISPNQFWFIAFLGLSFPIILIINFLFIIYWAVTFSFKFLYSFIAILIGITTIQRFIQFGTVKEQDVPNSINIVDFNTRAFGALDDLEYDPAIYFDQLDHIKPDVFCFQEFVSYNTKKDQKMFERLFTEYSSFYMFNLNAKTKPYTGYSLSIMSRFPIVKSGFVERMNSGGNCTIFVDIAKGGDTIRILNTHLKSIAFEKQDYQAVEGLKEPDRDISLFNVKHIAYKLKKAFIARSKQAEAIRKFIDESPHKVIITGDFNDSPASYAYNLIRGDMKDAFVESGSGFSSTYTGKMPSFRIDYILADKSFEIINYKPFELSFSDHKMISATIKLK
ncbi:MAG: endonuclease/exonuclease/phosphatase family protein [Bacteroidota bacterium]